MILVEVFYTMGLGLGRKLLEPAGIQSKRSCSE
jgi:hypothetical protein